MNKKKVLSLIMSICILGTGNFCFASKVSAETNAKPQINDGMLKVFGGEFTVQHKTPLMTGSGGTGYRICYLHAGDNIESISEHESEGSDGSIWIRVRISDGSTGWVCKSALD